MDEGPPLLAPYVIALLVAVPLLLVVIVVLVVYVCCAKRYKLNWYERTLLDGRTEEPGSSGVTSHLLAGSVSRNSHDWCSGGAGQFSSSGGYNTPVLVPETVVEYVTVRGNMGSNHSSPLSSPASDRSFGESYWEQQQQQRQKQQKPPRARQQQHKEHSAQQFPSGSLLSPWDTGLGSTMDSDLSSDERLDSVRHKDSVTAKDLPSLISALPFRRFSAGAAPTADDADVSRPPGSGPRVDKKRSNSLIPQLAMPFSNYLKSGASSKESSNTSLHETDSEAVSISPLPGGAISGGQRRRRASMQDALDITKINASLYQTEKPVLPKQDSMESVPEGEDLGSLHVSLTYDPEQSLLTVRLIQATDLQTPDLSGTPNPYCRLCLLPNHKLQLQSKVQRKTSSPEFGEDFIFDVPPAEIVFRTLEVLVYDFDQYSRDECIGQVHVPLCHLELSAEPVALWRRVEVYESQQHKQMHSDLGELMFSLAYLPSAERLTIVIMKARGLRGVDDTKTAASSKMTNGFVRVTLTAGGKRVKRKKTSTKRNSNNPVWNEALVFSISRDAINSIQVETAVYNETLLGNNELLGEVYIGPNSSGEELLHWNDVINSKSALARWHQLTQSDVT